MGKQSYLKWLRATLAILFFVPITFLFVDFTNLLPVSANHLLRYQVMPAILGGYIGIMVLQFILALVFGRLYCSVLCPAGTLQDIINRIFCIGKKKKKGVRRFKYRKPANILRYGLFAVTIVTALFGFTSLLVFLDPYSNFGRIAKNLFHPVYMWGNNLIADLLTRFDNHALYYATVSTVTIAGLVAAVSALVLFIVLVVLRGRLFCNTLCPVGALLSLISRFSLFRVSINKETCIKCGICESTCKAEAIDSKNMTVDASRCVDCFNCLSTCSKGSLLYKFNPSFPSVAKKEEVLAPATEKQAVNEPHGRRDFLVTTVAVASSVPVLAAITDAGSEVKKYPPVIPPGALNLERFKDKCTACHLCVVRCPSNVLRPAGLEHGFDFLLRPECAFIKSYCNYDCTVCSEVCPTGAIQFLTKEEKKQTQVGIAEFMIDLCVVYTDNTDCGACSEHCPLQAVRMVPYEGTLTIPEVTADLCVGCGGCESICPVRPQRAIIVRGNKEHVLIDLPEEEEVQEFEIDGFGF